MRPNWIKIAVLLVLLWGVIGGATWIVRKNRVTPERMQQLLQRFAGGLNEFGGQKVTGVVTKDGYKFLLNDGCWVMFRASGTEPVFRCYLEARSTRQLAAFRKAALALVEA